MKEVRVATMKDRQREVQLYRGQVPSPGRPTVAWREDRVRFYPEPVGAVGSELAGYEVVVDCWCRSRSSFAAVHTADPGSGHEPLNAFAPAADSEPKAQLGVHPR